MFMHFLPSCLVPMPAGPLSIVHLDPSPRLGGWQVKLGHVAFTFGWRRRG